MSDEASGPEDDQESVNDWKRRMSAKKGYPSGMDIDGMIFMEVIKNPWRSNEVSKDPVIKMGAYAWKSARRHLPSTI